MRRLQIRLINNATLILVSRLSKDPFHAESARLIFQTFSKVCAIIAQFIPFPFLLGVFHIRQRLTFTVGATPTSDRGPLGYVDILREGWVRGK